MTLHTQKKKDKVYSDVLCNECVLDVREHIKIPYIKVYT